MKTFIAVMLSGLIVGGSAALAEVAQAPVDRLAVAALEERPAHLDRLRSLVVAVEGEVVFARVYEGPGLSTPVNIKSLSKTVLAAVVGAAVDREVVSGMDQPVTE